jgi:hypothetical protein
MEKKLFTFFEKGILSQSGPPIAIEKSREYRTDQMAS